MIAYLWLVMSFKSDKKQNSELLRQVRFSAFSWGLSLILHVIIVSILMYLTFTHIQGAGQSQSESFTVEIGTASVFHAEQPGLLVLESADTPMPVIESSQTVTEIFLNQVDSTHNSADIAQHNDLAETITASQGFNESLVSVDTGGAAGFFGLSAGGSGFVYVIDCSGSMSDDKLTAALSELNRSIRALDKDQKFFIIFYNDTSIPMNAETLTEASSANKSKFLAWAYSVNAGGGTDPLQAMLHAFTLKPDAIWLLTDGIFAGDRLEAITKANKARIPIHTLAFGNEADTIQLQSIATNNKGKFRVVSFSRF